MSVTNKSETSTSNCCLDQHIVAKGGSGATCIFGGVADGVQYGVLATDYLLCKLLSSQRYNRVICICLDRRSDNIIATADRYIEQLEVSYVEYLRSRYALQTKYHILIERNLSWAHMFSYLNRCTNYLYNLCNCDKQIQELDSKNVRDKLRTIDGTVSDSGDLKDILNAITHQITMDSIQYDVSRVSDDRGSSDRSARNAVEVRNNNDRGSRVKQSGSTAILIYSLSELILSVGVAKSIRFINEMKASSALITMQRSSSSCFNSSSSGGSSGVDGGEKTVLTSPSCGDDNNAATAPSVKLQTEEGGTPLSILALVHTSLHTSHTLSRLLPQPQSSNSMFSSTGSPFNASVIVKPNDGSLSAQIICEMYVVRVSSLTSKVIEASNYFTEKAGQALLVPIVKTKILKEAPPEISTTAVTSSTFGNTKGEDQEKERARFAGSGTSKTVVSASVSVHDNRRMITFDSTDPEFDEDSDPDADLDL